MTEETFSKNFPDATIKKVLTNTEYNFDVKKIDLPHLKLTLIATDGLSNREMPVDQNHEAYRKIEVMFCLPEYFSLEATNWPIYWIDRIAQVPTKFDTWFRPGDTIPAGNPPAELTTDFKVNHFILSTPLELSKELEEADAECSFLSIIPIFQAELDYKLRNSGTALLMRLEKKGFTDKVDTFRTSVCRKRFLGF